MQLKFLVYVPVSLWMLSWFLKVAHRTLRVPWNTVWKPLLQSNQSMQPHLKFSTFTASFSIKVSWVRVPTDRSTWLPIGSPYKRVSDCNMFIASSIYPTDAQLECSKNVKIYMKSAPTCFGFSHPSSGSYYMCFAKVMNINNQLKHVVYRISSV